MATSNQVNPTASSSAASTGAGASARKTDFSGYLRAVEPERFTPANSTQQPLLLHRRINRAREETLNIRLLQATGVLVSAIWLTGAAVYIQRSIGWNNVSSMMPHEMGGFLAGILSPIALFWMIAAFVLRSNDVRKYAETLREEIQSMIFPSEEADRRVNNDIQRLMRQTEEMSKATRVALGAIEAARDGLKNQVHALNDNGSLTAERLEHLGAALYTRMQDIADMGKSLEQMINNVEDRTVQASARLEETVRRLDRGSVAVQERIAGATADSEQSVARLSDMLHERLEALGGLHKETETALQSAAHEMAAQRHELRVEAETIEEKAYQLADALQKSTGSLYAFTDDALDKAKLIETRLQGQAASLQTVLEQSRESSVSMSDMIESAMDELRRNIEANLDSVRDTTSHVADQSKTISGEMGEAVSDALVNFSTLMERNRAGFMDTLENGIAALEETAGKTVSTLQTSAMQAVGEADKIKGLLQDSVGDTLEQFRHITGESTYSLKVAAEDAVERAGKVEQVLQQAISRLEERSGAVLEQAQSGMGEATTRLVGEIDQTRKIMSDATERLSDQIGKASNEARDMSESMLAAVNRKIVDTSAAFTYIQKQIQALAGLFDQRKLDLDRAGLSARETAETLQRTLQLALDKVADTTRAVETGIASVHKSVQQPIALLEDAANYAYSRAGEISTMLGDKAGEMTQTAGELGEQLVGLHDQLTSKGQSVAEIAGKIAVHLKQVTDELQNQSELMDGRVTGTASSLEQITQAQKDISDSLSLLQEQSGKTAQQSSETTETIRKRVELLQQLYNALSQDAAVTEGGLARVSERLETLSDETVGKVRGSIESMTLLEADYHRLSEAGLEDINRIEQGYRRMLEKVQSETAGTAGQLSAVQEAVIEKTAQAGQALDAHLQQMRETAQQVDHTAKALAASGEVLDTQSARIQDFGQSAYATLQQVVSLSGEFDDRAARVNDLVTIHVRGLQDSMLQIQEQSERAIDTLSAHEQVLVANITATGEAAGRLHTGLAELRDETRQTEQAILQSANEIGQQQQRMSERADELSERLVDLRESTEQNSESLLSRLEAAAAHIDAKAERLEIAARTAEEQAGLLRQQESRLNRDAFLNSTKFIVESLHSLALDFTRLLDGELPDKTWKAYQKGDVASFTRRLLSVRDEDTRLKIYQKFKDDVEFRTYVQRYLRQYEEIYDAAAANDHAELLVSVFNGSDVGKLYTFLCNVLERTPRGSR